MSEVLLGQSYTLRFDPKLWQAMQPYPPLGALYAASYLRQKGYEVGLFDAMLSGSEGEWIGALQRERPRYAVLYEDNFNYLSKMCLLRMRQAAFSMIDAARQQGCTVIVAGSDATDHPLEYLQCGAHYVLLGEGELSLGELLDSLSGRSDCDPVSILGLAYRQPEIITSQASDGLPITLTPRRPDIKDLDALPFPAWDLVDVERYRRIWVKRHGSFSMNMVTTRGCPFHCNWCAKPIWGQRYNVRSPENVAAELKWLKERYQPDHIWFADDILGLKPGWLPRFADLVEEAGVRIPFKCLGRADLLLRPGEIPALKRAGAQIVWVGAESGAQHILDAMEKGTQVEQIYQAAQELHAAGIQVGFFLQFGYPGETWEDIQKTLQMVRECMPDDIGVSVSYPLPGTPFYQRVRDQLGGQQNWVTSDDMAMLYRGTYPTPFYRQLHRVIHKDYRLRKFVRSLNGLRRHPTMIRPRHASQAARSLYHALSLPFEYQRLVAMERTFTKNADFLPVALSPEESAQPTAQADFVE